MTPRNFKRASTLLTAMILLPVGVLAYWAADTTLPVENLTGRLVRIDPAPGHRVMWFEWTGTRNRYCDGLTQRTVLGAVIYSLPSRVIAPAPYGIDDVPGRKMTTYTPIEVPDFLPLSGRYRVRVEYYCNPLQQIFPLVATPPDIALPDTPHGNPDLTRRAE